MGQSVTLCLVDVKVQVKWHPVWRDCKLNVWRASGKGWVKESRTGRWRWEALQEDMELQTVGVFVGRLEHHHAHLCAPCAVFKEAAVGVKHKHKLQYVYRKTWT